MAIFSKEQCIERLGQWVEHANEKSDARQALLKINDRIVVESQFFNYEDIQKFMYILGRTACEWWIYPSASIGNRVELRVRLF